MRLTVSLVLVILLGSPVALARDDGAPRVAITSTTLLAPAASGAAVDAVSAALERGFVAGGLQVESAERVQSALSGHADLRGCVTPTCLAKIARLLKVALCAQVRVRKTGADYEATVLVTGGRGRALARRSQRCVRCAPKQVLRVVAQLGEAAAAQALGRLRTSVTPRPRRRGPRRCRLCWMSGAALLGVGLVATTAGATLWALHGDVYRSHRDYDRVYDTKAGGITGTVIGVSALVAGGALLVYGLLRKSAPPPVAIGVDPRRRVVTIGGRF